jgi:hypothetical protein
MEPSRVPLPPLSTTGVERVCYGAVSWLTGSVEMMEGETDGWSWVERLQRVWPVGTHRPFTRFYETGVVADDESWAVLWGGAGDAAGTVGVECRQRLWEALSGPGAVKLALDVLTAGVRPSRVDLVGVDGSGRIRPRDLLADWRGGRARTRIRTGKLWEELDGRQGLFIGSRSSDRYARLYEVRGEGGPQLRLETESKRGRAAEIGSGLLDGRDPSDLWAAELRGAIDFPELADWGALFE